MGPGGYSATNLSSSSSLGSVQELQDYGSNWLDYQSWMEKVLGAKGLWRYVVGTAIVPELYAMVNGVPVLKDGTPATDEEVEANEDEIIKHEKRDYLAQHMILSTISTRLEMKVRSLMLVMGMWDVVKADATSMTMIPILDAERQLLSMKLQEDEDPETHLVEMKEYSQAVVKSHENFTEMASEILDARINALVTSSPPKSCCPMLQTVTAAEAEQALVAHEELIAIAKGKDKKKSKTEDKGMNAKSKINCHNCGKVGHKKHACYSIEGGKEAQAPWQTKHKSKDMQDDNAAVVTANHENNWSFTS